MRSMLSSNLILELAPERAHSEIGQIQAQLRALPHQD